MSDERIYGIGAVAGVIPGLLAGMAIFSRLGLAGVAVFALAGFGIGASIASMIVAVRRWRRDRREGRYDSPGWRSRPRFRRWTWSLTVGAALGWLAGLAYFDQSTAPSPLPHGVDVIGGGILTALIGVLGAAAVERVIAGPGEPGRERLGAFFFTGPNHAMGAIVAGAVIGILTVRDGLEHGALGFGLGLMVGWVGWGIASSLLGSVNGGRDFLPERWTSAARGARIDAITEVVVPGGAVRVRLRGESVRPSSVIRVELELRLTGEARTPDATAELSGRRSVDERQIVASRMVRGSDLDAEGTLVELPVPLDAPPTLDHELLRVQWVVKASTPLRVRPDVISEAVIEVIPRVPPGDGGVLAQPGRVLQGRTGLAVRSPDLPIAALVRESEMRLGLGESIVDEVGRMPGVSRQVPPVVAFELPVPVGATPSMDSSVARIRWHVSISEGDTVLARVPIFMLSARGPSAGLTRARTPLDLRPPLRERLVVGGVGLGIAILFYIVTGGGGQDGAAPAFVPPTHAPYTYVPPNIVLPTYPTFPSFVMPSFSIPSVGIRPLRSPIPSPIASAN